MSVCVRVDECLVPEDRLECENNISRLKTIVETCEVSVTTTAAERWEGGRRILGFKVNTLSLLQHAQSRVAVI